MSPLPDKYLILIQKYFRDELSEIEQKEFDQALEEPEFRSEVDMHAQVFEGLVAAKRENLRAAIVDVKDEFEKTRNSSESKNSFPKVKTLRWLFIAAAMLFLVCSLYFFFQNDSPDYDAIYAEYYVPYDTPESQRGGNEVKNSPLDEAMSLYENEKYADALSIVNSISPKSEYVQLLSANCYMNLGQWELAESVLKSLSDSKDNKISQHAEWYLSLSYIKSNKMNLARDIFYKIKSTPNHLYHKRVIKLIEDYSI